MADTAPDHAAARTSGFRRAVGSVTGAVPGALLGAAFGAVAVVRRTKPLHPAGRVGNGTLRITRTLPDLGVPLLTVEGTHPCTVRWSRSVGLPAPLPDVEGLALRLEDTGSDLLFASTGTGRLSRFVLALRAPGRHGAQSTLLPVATDSGSLLFKVEPADAADPPSRYDLAVAHSGSEWEVVGSLEVAWGPDRPTRFDPVENPLPGTAQYPLVRTLREPAYFLARRGADAQV
jgi:hypothetical protein